MEYAVFLLDQDGNYIPISYGSDELVCQIWIKDHRKYFPTDTVLLVGTVTTATISAK